MMNTIRFIFVNIILSCICIATYGQYSRVDIAPVNGVYSFSYNQTPDDIVPRYPSVIGTSYVWESSPTPNIADFLPTGVTSASYHFTLPLTATKYFRRIITISGVPFPSNIVEIKVVSLNWEDRNYARVHQVLVPAQTDWKAVDALPIGQKIQTTAYFDGLGRKVQMVSREMATPDPSTPTVWGDVVGFHAFDEYGREQKQYKYFSTSSTPGKYKSSPSTAQAQYYTAVYNETSAFATLTFDNSPLNRVTNLKYAGTAWAANQGDSYGYDMNTATENVKIFTIGMSEGDVPSVAGTYADNTLFKTIYTDVNGKKTIEYRNLKGQTILKKIQIDDAPSITYTGWICTYYIYDDFDRLRYVIQPEGVKYLDLNAWSFAGTNGLAVLEEQCIRNEYDEKGRNVLRKNVGSDELYMIYDQRDRLVFTQDGNQRAKTPDEWTATLYDELDRPTITTLYKTSKLRSDLQSDIGLSFVSSTVTVTNPSTNLDNLLLDERVPSITTYNARKAIEITSGFESAAADDFTVEIISTAQSPGQSVTTTMYKSPISSADLNNAAVTTILEYFFYDHYNFPGKRSFHNEYDNLLAYPTQGDAIVTSNRTLSMVTGTMVRVLNSDNFLSGTIYYDEKGRTVQTLDDNIKSGKDVVTTQYQFDGRVLSSNTKHWSANTGYANYSIVSKNIYDKIGRLSGIDKKFGNNAFKSVVTYSMDDAGRLKTRKLAPGYTGSGKTEMESLTYTYNLHNDLTGINKDYALKTPGKYDKWANFFGVYVGYDNVDGLFSAARLNGQTTGVLWSTMGDDAQRKYDYTYDNANRLAKGLFNEKNIPSDAWSNAKIDYTVTGASGMLTYDLNGNLISMIQKGVVPGTSSPVNVDNLTYSYNNLSSRLSKVVDNGTLAGNNGKLGDFTDGTNAANNDYVYDPNGNVVIDLNKSAKELGNQVGANGIRYNYLDKPEEIHISGKGTITFVYDAEGNKLQRSFTPDGGGAASAISYINEFIYKGDNLQFITFEEGRVRALQKVASNNGYDALSIDGTIDLVDGARGTFDYFILDQLKNVRMLLTDEVHSGSNSCTMEISRAANEEPLFGKVDANGNPSSGNEVQARFAVSSIPGQSSGGGWQNGAIGNHVSRIGNLAGNRMGPNALLKVMAGDLVSATTIYYYANPVTNSSGSTTLLANLLQSLGQAISGNGAASGITKASSSNITGLLGTSVPFQDKIAPDASNATGTNPKAYLAVMFFDERFNFVPSASTTIRVSQSGNGAAPLVLTNIKAPKNGYAYVYVSNESDEMLYFDNLQVSHERGRIIEENHFYAHGLKMAALSAEKLANSSEGETNNNNLYQGAFAELDNDIGWQDFRLRGYDAQIGRFVQADPFGQFASQYTGIGNDPANLIDPTGGIGIDFGSLGEFTGSVLADRALATLGGAAVGFGIDKLAGGNGWKGAAIGGGVVLAGTFVPPFDIEAVSDIFYKAASMAVNTVNALDKVLLHSENTTFINVVVLHGIDQSCYDDGAGGKLGGHVLVNFGDETLYGFTGWGIKKGSPSDDPDFKDVPLFPSKDQNGEKWFSKIHGSEYHGNMSQIQSGLRQVSEDDPTLVALGVATTFRIPVTQEQYDGLKGWYEGNLGKSPYPYTQFGMRCASSVYSQLVKFGVVKNNLPLNSATNAFGPGFLFNYLWNSGYQHSTVVNLLGIDKSKVNFYHRRSIKRMAGR